MVFMYYTPMVSNAHDTIGIPKSQLLYNLTPFLTINATVLPVFEPNDYFWANHWQEGKEEKWEAYARAVRVIMAYHHGDGMQMVSQDMEDKLVFKDILRDIKKGQKREHND